MAAAERMIDLKKNIFWLKVLSRIWNFSDRKDFDQKLSKKENQIKNNCLVSNFLRQIEISRSFLPPVSHGEKSGKFQFV